MTDAHNSYRDIYGPERSDAHGWIQWKGTDVCIDLLCPCGRLSHVDVLGFYAFECPGCHTKYAVGQTVPLIPLTEEQIPYFPEYTLGS